MAYFNGKPGGASGLLRALLTVDGAGSLFDADLLDSLSSAAFARSGANTDITSLAGTTTNDSAAAGKIGELITSELLTGSAVSLTTATAADVTSISLTAGDWDVSGLVVFKPTNAGTTMTKQQASTSQTSATLNTAPRGGYYEFNGTLVDGENQSAPLVQHRVSVASTTTLYMVAKATFDQTCAAFGVLSARRVR